MEERMIWKGLQVSDFIHPGEVEARDALIRSAAFQKAVSLLSGASQMLNRTVVEGTYIQLSKETAPRVIKILEDVCWILDWPSVPALYVCRKMAQIVTPFCRIAETSSGSGFPETKENYLVMSDYVLRNFDEDMLYYSFGNAVTMIMAGHVKITTVAAYMGSSLWTVIPQMKFKQYLHMADSTSDRGGLLACQSMAAAARCHLLEMGLPLGLSRRLLATPRMTGDFLEQYLKEALREERRMNGLNRAARMWIDAAYMEGAAGGMLEELYQWYRKGYRKLRERYEERIRQGGDGCVQRKTV